jgi:hypothetical protein
MSQSLHLLETLETHLEQIRADLGADWPEFAARVRSLAPAFQTAEDEIALARAVGDLYMACRAREPVMAILRQTADTSGVGHDRRPSSGGTDYGNTMLIRDIANRFQSLLSTLEEMEHPEGRRDRRSGGIANSGGSR